MSEAADRLSNLKLHSKNLKESKGSKHASSDGRTRITSMMDQKEIVNHFNDIHVPSLGTTVKVPVVKGFFPELPKKVQQYIAKYVSFDF